jgi:AraC-like DNA-binding protein
MATPPQLIDFSRLSSIAEPDKADIREYFFLNPEMGMVRSGTKVFRMINSHLSPPLIIDDHRFGLVTQGEATVTINLQEKTLRAGMMAYLAPGSIVTDIHFSPDFDVRGLALFASYPMPFPADRLPGIFNGEVRDFQCPANNHLLDITHRLMDLIWLMITSQESPDRTTLNSLIATLMCHYDSVYHVHGRKPSTREQTIYDRFIYLVSRYAKQEHHLAFYADKMCLTERYLGSVVRQVSGLTAKQWIDKSLIACLQSELRHSDKTLAQLADEMNFPNPSFLCKYFKRLTTLSPLAYRNGR